LERRKRLNDYKSNILMWLLIILGLIAAAALSVWLGLVPPPHAATLIRIKHGQLHLRKGQLRAYAKDHASEILASAGVSSGFIAITPQNSVVFSRQIPPAIRQRLRNVLLNQSS
jgi:hypothetical protein